MKNITITISGGAVQDVDNPTDKEIIINDYDVETIDVENTPNCKQDENGEWYQSIIIPAQSKL